MSWMMFADGALIFLTVIAFAAYALFWIAGGQHIKPEKRHAVFRHLLGRGAADPPACLESLK